MIYGIIGILIGILVMGFGIYFLIKEKDDPESKKIYGIASVIGIIIAIVSIVIVITQ